MHLIRRAHTALLHVDGDNLDADFVAVKYRLSQHADAWRDLLALLAEGCVQAHLADYLAYGGFRSLHHRSRRVLGLKKIGASVAQPILHRKLYVENVFIFGQHRRITQAGGLDDGVTAHVNRANLGHHHDFMPLHRVRQTPVKTCANC